MIRDALPSDYPAIRAVVRHAFGQTYEADLIDDLRADGDALFELVAGDETAIWGHIVYSPLPIERAGETVAAAALGPVSVLPAFQHAGAGTALIQEGNARCAQLGLGAVVVLGDPAYYRRFGFSPEAAESLEAPFSGSAFMALELTPGALKNGGRVRYAAAFGARI